MILYNTYPNGVRGAYERAKTYSKSPHRQHECLIFPVQLPIFLFALIWIGYVDYYAKENKAALSCFE